MEKNIEIESSTSDDDTEAGDLVLDSDTESEDLAQDSNLNIQENGNNEQDIQINQFYEVYYETPTKNWYVGEIIKETKKEIYQMSFLKSENNIFIGERFQM